MYEVMDRNTNRFHSEHGTLAAAVAAAKTLTLAEVYLTDGGNVVRTVFEHGGRTCTGCGEFAPNSDFRKGLCSGCQEQDRWNQEIYAANRGDVDGWY